jgi:hypothetical protein
MTKAYVASYVWTNTQDVILQAAITKYGLHAWSQVASMLKTKTPAECKARWTEYLSPTIKKDHWSHEEEQLLLTLVKSIPNQWQTIAQQLRRTATQCVTKYRQLSWAALNEKKNEQISTTTSGVSSTDASGQSTTTDPADKFNYNNRAEHRAARADAEDLDEGESELLQTAQARLANTAGKKDKRKMRELQIRDAKETAKLAKLRQLEAAGIKTKGRDDDLSFIQPLTRLPKITKELFDTRAEREKEAAEHGSLSLVGKSVADIEGLTKGQKTMVAKQKASEKEAQQKKENLPAYIMKQTLLNDHIILQQRGELVLPGVNDHNDTMNDQSMGRILYDTKTTTKNTTTSLTQGPIKRKLQSLDPIKDLTSDVLEPTTIVQGSDGYINGEGGVKKQRFVSSLEGLLSGENSSGYNTLLEQTRAESISSLSSKLAALSSLQFGDEDATKTNINNTTNTQTKHSQSAKSTKIQTTVKKTTTSNNNASLLESIITNIDANLKDKILKHHNTTQAQLSAQQYTTLAKSSVMFTTNSQLPLPDLLDTTFGPTWPVVVGGATQYGLNQNEMMDVQNMLQEEFTALYQLDMTDGKLTQDEIFDREIAKKLVFQEEENSGSFSQEKDQNPPHDFPPIYFNPNTQKFLSLSHNESHPDKRTILRQQALLYYRWLDDLLYNKNNPIPTDPNRPHIKFDKTKPTSKLNQLRHRLGLEFKGYGNKKVEFEKNFKELGEKNRELCHDYDFYQRLLQQEHKSIESRANNWMDLISHLQKEHQQLQETLYKLKRG